MITLKLVVKLTTFVKFRFTAPYISRQDKSKSRRVHNAHVVNTANQTGGEVAPSERLVSAMLSEAFAAMIVTNGDHEDDGAHGLEKSAYFSADPTSYAEAIRGPNQAYWKAAMREEWNSLLEMNTFQIYEESLLSDPTTASSESDLNHLTPIQLPFGIKAIGSKWIYKTKCNPDGSTRYKVRLVIRGFQQVSGVDFDETYAPVSKLTTLRLLLSLAAQYHWVIGHMDVVTAFLNPRIDRDNIYMTLPLGMEWIDPRTTTKMIVRLLKALYGLKQAPRLWYEEINAFLLSIGFSQSSMDPNLYLMAGAILLLYVDDILIFYCSPDRSAGDHVKDQLRSKYRMTDLGLARRFLGLEIDQNDEAITLSQQQYINTILHRFDISTASDALSPMDLNVRLDNVACEDMEVDRKLYLSIVGSLMYAALGTRPDISYSVTALSRYNVQPLKMHLTAAKRTLRYLKRTSKFKLSYPKPRTPPTPILRGFTDSDWAGSTSNRKSVGGCIFFANEHGSPIQWQAKSQSVVALSTLEAEYVACSDATREALWLRLLHFEILNTYSPNVLQSPLTVPIGCDNQGALKLLETGVVRQKTKHIAVKYHHSHDEQIQGNVRFHYVTSASNLADILTKPLAAPKHQKLTLEIGLKE